MYSQELQRETTVSAAGFAVARQRGSKTQEVIVCPSSMGRIIVTRMKSHADIYWKPDVLPMYKFVLTISMVIHFVYMYVCYKEE